MLSKLLHDIQIALSVTEYVLVSVVDYASGLIQTDNYDVAIIKQILKNTTCSYSRTSVNKAFVTLIDSQKWDSRTSMEDVLQSIKTR